MDTTFCTPFGPPRVVACGPGPGRASANDYSTGCAARPELPDDLIEELIGAESAPAQLTVVSDDRRIRDAARRRGCHVLGGLDYFESTEGTKPPPSQAPQDPNGKPEHVAPEEKERWLQEFGGTENV